MLYDFQKDAVLAIISKLEKYNGCILADSVGLGKTFTALAVIKYYENRNKENRNKSVLVLCPKKLSENWNTYKSNYINNPIAEDRLRYDVLYYTDLSREHGQSNGIDLDCLNWGNYDLVVIAESHNFRNGGEVSGCIRLCKEEKIMKRDVVLFVKVSQKQWVESLRNGTVCFNPVDIFIKKAELENNNEQGDKYEGVFARLKTSDELVNKLKIRFGEDLEIIPDVDHVLLRRKSARKVPIFCIYGVRKNELEPIKNSVHKVDGEYFCTVIYHFPQKIYDGFLGINDVWGFYASSGHFLSAIEKVFIKNKLNCKKAIVNYDIDLDKEFYFEPDDEYSELIHKRKDLSYQHEIRYRLLDFPQNQQYLVKYRPLSSKSCGIAQGALLLKMRCRCKLDG